MKDLKDNKYGQLTVLKLSHVKIYKSCKRAMWLCQCDCGNLTVVDESNLISGKTCSCGECECKKKTRLLHNGITTI